METMRIYKKNMRKRNDSQTFLIFIGKYEVSS